jgi:uncharacterized protein (UPF0332 family)
MDKETLINHRIRQSEEALTEVTFLLENKRLSLAVNRIYYSIFYIISALAIKNDFSTSKHRQLIGWFNKNFIKTGKAKKEYSKMIYTAAENREKSDYDFLFELTKEEIMMSYKSLQNFIGDIKALLSE